MSGTVGRTLAEVTDAWEGPLPEPVRARVVVLAAEVLGALPEDEVPSSLRRYRPWAAAKRARLAATPLAAALERDVVFRQRVFARAQDDCPDLTTALDSATMPPAADPYEVAAIAYLGRTPGWGRLVAAAAEEVERLTAEARRAREVERQQQVSAEEDAARAALEVQVGDLADQLAAERAQVAALQRELRDEKGARRRAERAAATAGDEVERVRQEAADAVTAAQAELSRARSRQAEAESALLAARRAAKEGRNLEDTRLRLLLDTVLDAAAGLRRELALPPPGEHPADLVDALRPGDPADEVSERALLSEDPALLDKLLALPQVHLVVDGYNVTLTGYPDLPLEQQRTRLVSGLASLAARCGAEVTCCFDGASVAGRVPALSGRGVRVLFSKPGEIADELIRRLVRAEPVGRPVVVVSSDREVADGVRRAGARPVSSAALLRRLDRA